MTVVSGVSGQHFSETPIHSRRASTPQQTGASCHTVNKVGGWALHTGTARSQLTAQYSQLTSRRSRAPAFEPKREQQATAAKVAAKMKAAAAQLAASRLAAAAAAELAADGDEALAEG